MYADEVRTCEPAPALFHHHGGGNLVHGDHGVVAVQGLHQVLWTPPSGGSSPGYTFHPSHPFDIDLGPDPDPHDVGRRAASERGRPSSYLCIALSHPGEGTATPHSPFP